MSEILQNEKIEISEFVPIENLRLLRSKIADLNKKAKKNSLPEISISYGKRTTKRIKYFDDSITVEMVQCIITGEYPRLPGYEFIAKLEKHGERNLILGAKKDIDEKWETKKGVCDHCKSKRDRKETYIIKKIETGEVLQIGSSCIDLFIGSSSLSSIAARAAFFAIFDNRGLFEPSQTERDSKPISTIEFLSAVIAVTKKYGYVTAAASSSTVHKKTTGYMAYLLINPMEMDPIDAIISSADRELAEKAILNIDLVLSSVANQSLRANIKTLYSCPDLEIERINLAALLGKFCLETEGVSTVAATIKKKEKILGDYIGEIGEKREFIVEVGKRMNFHSRYNQGGTNMILMEDEAGNTLVIMTGGNFDPETGSKIKIKATIKAHKEYREVKQTVIQRASILMCEEIENLKKSLSSRVFEMTYLPGSDSIERGSYEGDIRSDIEKECEKFGMVSNSCNIYSSYSDQDLINSKTVNFNLEVRSRSSHKEDINFQLVMVPIGNKIVFTAKLAD